MEPLKISKVNTVSQILFIIVALASAAFAFNIDLILQLLGYGSACDKCLGAVLLTYLFGR